MPDIEEIMTDLLNQVGIDRFQEAVKSVLEDHIESAVVGDWTNMEPHQVQKLQELQDFIACVA